MTYNNGKHAHLLLLSASSHFTLKDVQKHSTWKNWSVVSGAQVQKQTVKEALGVSLTQATSVPERVDGSHTLFPAS